MAGTYRPGTLRVQELQVHSEEEDDETENGVQEPAHNSEHDARATRPRSQALQGGGSYGAFRPLPTGGMALHAPARTGSGSGSDSHSGRGQGSSRRHMHRGEGRLPVFFSLQGDSGSERGSSRRSERSSPTNSIDSLTSSFDSLFTDGTVAPRMLIRELASKMRSADESKAAAAAKNVHDIVREGCATWRQNQTEICRSHEMLQALASLLRSPSERCRYEACRALGNIAFQNPGLIGQALPPGALEATGAADALETDNCLALVRTVGMLDGLRYVLQVGSVNSKHEAARVVNNCAAYSVSAAQVIVQSSGLIQALKGLCGAAGRAQRTRAKAIGAINCLSTYDETRPYLVSSRVVEDALIPALHQKKKAFGDSDEFKAMQADAVMATANLVGKNENSPIATEPDGLRTVIKCLRHGLDRHVWAGITWTSYSSLLPLSNLTVSDCNKELLAELGLVELLVRAMAECISSIEEELAMECLENMVFLRECRRRMVACGAVERLGLLLRGNASSNRPASTEDVMRRAQHILWWLTKRESPELLQLVQVHQTPFTGRHILLSYDADSELDGYLDSVNQIRNHLASMGHTIWAKKDCAEPELAENIACATLVIIFISRAYKESPTCRLQGQFADEAQKRILPMLLEPGYNPDAGWGWLGKVDAPRPRKRPRYLALISTPEGSAVPDPALGGESLFIYLFFQVTFAVPVMDLCAGVSDLVLPTVDAAVRQALQAPATIRTPQGQTARTPRGSVSPTPASPSMRPVMAGAASTSPAVRPLVMDQPMPPFGSPSTPERSAWWGGPRPT